MEVLLEEMIQNKYDIRSTKILSLTKKLFRMLEGTFPFY